jgi:hypothetical protein
MPLYTKKEFAYICKLKTKELSVYISRNKVVVEQDFIDSENDVNKIFIEKREVCFLPPKEDVVIPDENPYKNISKKEKKTPKKEVESENNQDDEVEESSDVPTLHKSTILLKHLDTVKRGKEIEKLQIEIQKKKGEVVPVELIKPVILQHNQSILTEFKNAGDEILRIMSKKYSFSVEDLAYCKGEFVRTINNSMSKAIFATTKSIDLIIQSHIEKKAVGEHG